MLFHLRFGPGNTVHGRPAALTPKAASRTCRRRAPGHYTVMEPPAIAYPDQIYNHA